MSNLLNIKDENGNWIPIPIATNGIASIIQNSDYTLTITLEDGTTYTTTSIRGEQGAQGDKGDKGDSFTYSDFTPEQLASLKGEKGDKGDQGERGIQGIQGERGEKGDTGSKGDKGDAFTYADFTPEQLASLKGERGEQGIQGVQGEKGDAFTYADFTPEQLVSLKGEKGDKGDQGIQGIKGDTGDKGDKGDAFTYSDFTPEQLASLKGEKGDKGEDGQDYVLTENDKQEIAGLVDAPVEDVQVNGTSIVTDGVANISIPEPDPTGMVVKTTLVSGNQYTIDSTYDIIKATLSSGINVIVMAQNIPQPYVGNVQMDGVWYLAFGVSTTYNNYATLVGFLIPETYQNIAVWVDQSVHIPTLDDSDIDVNVVWSSSKIIDELSQKVGDVQVNGTSIVQNSVANILIDTTPTQGSTNAVSSGGVYDALIDTKNELPEIRTPDETEADLYIGDSDGNVLVKLASGAIETKNFKGFQYITYKSESVTYSTLPLTLTVNHKFKKGDRVVLHVDRGAMPWDYGAYVNYYEDDRLVSSGKRIDCAWIEHVITEDTDTIIATYTGQPSTAGMTVGDVYTLEVSLLGDIPIKPTVVKVKKDGTGDYTTLRGALDAIGAKANDVLNPYRIEIYAGTYDVMDDYTDEEISTSVYDQTSFVGSKLLNGMYLVGIGAPNEVILNGDLDTTKWSSDIRGNISTLNCQGSCGFENLTVIANHLRYCVHDDFHTTIGKKPKRIVKDCIFRGYDISYNPGTTYGAGTSDSGCDYEFINCDFGENAGVHTLPTIAQKSFVHLVNCKGHGFRIGDQETSDPVDGYSIYQFDNCDFLWINHNMSDDVPHVIVRGSGNGSPIYQFPTATLYDTGDVVAMRNGGFSQICNVGEFTEWFSNAGHGPRFRKATSVNGASGIVVYKDANDTYIQTKGYVCTNRTTLTTFALGDYIGIANSLPVVVSDASDAIGRIAYIDNSGNGYIKLNFGG